VILEDLKSKFLATMHEKAGLLIDGNNLDSLISFDI
jgi:hypothetical protein